MQRHEFETAIDNMKPGDRIVYHVGNLWSDRNFGPTFMQVDNTATAAWKAMEAGKVHLLQDYNLDTGNYIYLAIKRPPPFESVRWMGCYHPRHAEHIRADAKCRGATRIPHVPPVRLT